MSEQINEESKELLTATDVCERFNWSKPTLWRRVKSGKFPPAISLGGMQKVWTKADVDGWLNARIAERDRRAA